MWAETEYVGCAMTHCTRMTEGRKSLPPGWFTVCNYGPAWESLFLIKERMNNESRKHPQNVHNVHVTWCIALKNDRIIFCIAQFDDCLQPISKLWNHSWYTETGGFIVHWSKNTSFVTICVTLWITAFYEEEAKVFCITLQHLKEFYHFIAKLMNKWHSSQWEFG